MGRVLNKTRHVTGDINRDFAYTYDKSGKLSTQTYPDNYVLTMNYYPGTGLLFTVVGSESGLDDVTHATYTYYDPAGRTEQVTFPNNTNTVYDYDPKSMRLTSIVTQDNASNLIQGRTYGYTRAGDIDSIEDDASGITYGYYYDRLHRLIKEETEGPAPSVGLARLGYRYENTNHAHAVSTIDLVSESNFNGTPCTFNYDELGRPGTTTGPHVHIQLDIGGRLYNPRLVFRCKS